jgi:hypothetical protein
LHLTAATLSRGYVAGIAALYALADPALLECISSLVEVITEVSLGYGFIFTE